jgi:D-serine deaminase-like pyridoxal phosphate-dependent protein
MTRIEDLDTPSVTILLDRLEANIDRGQREISRHGLDNRPHIKTHKIPAIAKMQIDKGAVGITCQKIGEAEVFADAQITDDILITYNILGDAKLERLMALRARVPELSVVADNEVVVRGLSDACRRHGRDIGLLIECDGGFGRNGVQTPEAALDLARLALNLPGIRFKGLMVYPSNAPNTPAFFMRAIELFKAEGIPLPVLSGGGTPAMRNLSDYGMMTEHRAGTYVYNDVMMVHQGVATWDDCAMQVRATVISRPTEDRAVIDAGSKILTSDKYYVENHGRLVEYPEAAVKSLSEEHAVIDLSLCRERPKIGEVLSVVPNHCCVVSNMVDEVYGVRNGAIETTWKVAARGKTR